MCDAGMSDICAPGLVCLQSVCARYPAEGEDCTDACDALADFCDPSTMKCAPKIALGAACPSGFGCVDDARCDAASGTCVAKAKAGQSCDVNVPGASLGSLRCSPTASTCALPDPSAPCP